MPYFTSNNKFKYSHNNIAEGNQEVEPKSAKKLKISKQNKIK